MLTAVGFRLPGKSRNVLCRPARMGKGESLFAQESYELSRSAVPPKGTLGAAESVSGQGETTDKLNRPSRFLFESYARGRQRFTGQI